jgi:L-iditol 2-dehydrogenase
VILVQEEVRRITSGRGGADVVIEAVGSQETAQRAMGIVRCGGTISLFGGCPSGTHIPLDSTLIHYFKITIKANFHHTPRHTRKVLDVIRRGQFESKSLITGHEHLSALSSVLESLLNRNGDLKIAIIP